MNPTSHTTHAKAPAMGANADSARVAPDTCARDLTASRLFTAEQLAERWQVPTAHVYRLGREGGLPVVRIGRYMRFRLEQIEAWEHAGGSHAA